jgi:hypothetical protein
MKHETRNEMTLQQFWHHFPQRVRPYIRSVATFGKALFYPIGLYGDASAFLAFLFLLPAPGRYTTSESLVLVKLNQKLVTTVDFSLVGGDDLPFDIHSLDLIRTSPQKG